MFGNGFYELTRLRLRVALRAKGLGFRQINEQMAGVTDGLIDVAAEQSKSVGAIGDGTFIQKILDFLNSDLGKALIAALIALLGL